MKSGAPYDLLASPEVNNLTAPPAPAAPSAPSPALPPPLQPRPAPSPAKHHPAPLCSLAGSDKDVLSALLLVFQNIVFIYTLKLSQMIIAFKNTCLNTGNAHINVSRWVTTTKRGKSLWWLGKGVGVGNMPSRSPSKGLKKTIKTNKAAGFLTAQKGWHLVRVAGEDETERLKGLWSKPSVLRLESSPVLLTVPTRRVGFGF